jgi:hypothetical protein
MHRSMAAASGVCHTLESVASAPDAASRPSAYHTTCGLETPHKADLRLLFGQSRSPVKQARVFPIIMAGLVWVDPSPTCWVCW